MSTAGNNTLFLDSSNPGIVGLAGGNDRYVLSANGLSAGQQITISDAEGANTLQLAGGLAIASSQVSNNAIQLTLTNGAIVNVLNASTFTFLTGGDAFTGTGGLTQTYAQFVTVALGSTVPAAGATPVAVGPVTLVDPSVPVVPVSSFTLTTTATSVAEAAPIEFTLTGDVSAIDQTFNLVISGDDKNGTAGITKADAADFPADVVKTVVLLAGETSVNFTITPVANDGVEGAQGFKVSVLDSSFSPVVSSDTVVITDAVVVVPSSLNLTVGEDSIIATAAGQTFTAPVVQNSMGAQTNTLGDGDVIAGVGTDNKLTVDLVLTTSGAIPVGSAISAATNNIQVVELRAQTINLDVGGPHLFTPSHIDAEKMFGVQEWWSVNSRSGLQVEDVRSRPEDTTIGMRDTDPEVGFRVYFDPDQLSEVPRTEDSQLTLTVADVLAPPGDISGVPIDGLSFQLDGVSYTLRSAEIGAAATTAEFVAGLQAALALQPALATVGVMLNADNTITLEDSAGKPFTLGSWFFVNDSVPANGNIVFKQTVGDPSLIDVPIATNVVLDNVGRTSPGGVLDIGSLGDGGVAQFDVVVDRASWVTSMQSNSHLNDPLFAGPIQSEHLETVNFTSTGANGNVTVGQRGFDLDGRVYNGLVDVREVDGSAFMGKMNLGIVLNEFGGLFLDGSSARYLDGATGPVEFSYSGSAQADTFNIFVDPNVSNDPDFRMDVDMGAADDRLILSGADNLNNISVDGGTGNNTFVTSTSVGTGINPADIADHEFASFKNFQNFEVEGNTNTSQDFTNLVGVTSVIVATQNVDTTLIDLPVANVILSGKNQTIGANSNDDQDFGTIDIQGADAATMTVTLQNTARVDGELYVDELEVNDFSAANQSAVRTLNIVSNGARQTTNWVDHIHAERVNTFNFSGTQDLFADIQDAANTNGPIAGITNLVANGSALTGSFDLAIDSQIVTAVDAAGKTATFTGTAGTTDSLTFDGAITATANTMVTGFETVVFESTSGNFDASGVSGVTLYELDSLNGDLNLNHLRSIETVLINTDAGEANADNMFTFATEAAASSSSLQLNFLNTDDPSVAGDLDFSAAGDGIATKGFTTVNMNLGGAAGNADVYLFDLMFQDNAGLVVGDVGFDFAKVAAKNLVITGGQASASNLGDVAVLGNLSATLKVIDFSGYKGATVASLDNPFVAGDSPSAPTAVSGNTLVKVNGFTMLFADADHTVNDTITTFEFTTDAVSATQDWVIGNFMGENDVAGSLSNVTILDMSDLNVNGLVDLIQTQVGGDVHITSNEGLNFEIVLVGTNLADVGLANFQFAA